MEHPKTNHAYEIRRYTLIGAVIFVILVYVVRLFLLQIVDVEYKASADNNAFLKKTLYPARGVIYDRNDKLLVYNQPAYDVMLIMREIQPFDTLDFCRKRSSTSGLPTSRTVRSTPDIHRTSRRSS